MGKANTFLLLSLSLLVLLSACVPASREDIVRPNEDTLAEIEGFIQPIPNANVLTRFGELGSGISLTTRKAGEAVRAAQSGTVTELTLLSVNDGYLVTLEHGAAISTSYLNLKASPLVMLGDTVRQGEVLGYLGGGSLTPANVLKFFASKLSSNGKISFIDPAQLLGLN